MPGTPYEIPKLVCDACQRAADSVRGSMWHGDHRICCDCFYQWYDPDNEEVDVTSALSIGNYVRKKHGLPPLRADGESTI
jgi:hypothetical protein